MPGVGLRARDYADRAEHVRRRRQRLRAAAQLRASLMLFKDCKTARAFPFFPFLLLPRLSHFSAARRPEKVEGAREHDGALEQVDEEAAHGDDALGEGSRRALHDVGFLGLHLENDRASRVDDEFLRG